MLSCSARWYSTPGVVGTFPAACAADGTAAGVVQTKCVVSICILSLHFPFISCKAILAFSKSTVS